VSLVVFPISPEDVPSWEIFAVVAMLDGTLLLLIAFLAVIGLFSISGYFILSEKSTLV
jgi:hypothetical protein